MKKGYYLIIAFLCVSLFVSAQTLTVQGIVNSEDDGEPVPEQEMFIYVTDGEWSLDSNTFVTELTETNEEGHFSLEFNLQELGFDAGFVQVSTMSCGMNLEENQDYGDGNYDLVYEFVVCTQDSIWNDECEAAFEWYPAMDSLQGITSNEIHFMDYSYGEPTSWSWNFGDGSTSVEQNPIHIYEEEGEYEVCLEIVALNGECESIYCDVVYVEEDINWDECEAIFGWYPEMDSLQGMVSNSVSFYDYSYGEPTEWYWNFGDGTISQEQNPIHIYEEEGEYEVCLEIVADNGECESVFCDVVFVGDSIIWEECEAYFEYYSENDSLNTVNPNEFQFMDMSMGEIDTWYWDFGDGNYSEEQNPTHIYENDGMYWVCLQTSNSEGNCQSSFCEPVLVGGIAQGEHDVYGQVFADEDPILMGDVMIIGVDNYYYDYTTIDSLGYYEFSGIPDGNYFVWAFPYFESEIAEMYLPTFYGNTIFFEEAEIIELGEEENPYNIELVSLEDVLEGIGNITGNITGGQKSTTSNMVVILTDEFNVPIRYEVIQIGQEFDFSDLDYGTYKLYVEAAGITSDPITVILSPENPTVNMDMSINGGLLLTDVESTETTLISSIYPNPVIDFFSMDISSDSNQDVEISIYTTTGKLVEQYSHRLINGKNRIRYNINNLRSGVYIVSLRDSNGRILSKRFVI